ncbi:hypothetical protein LZ339_25595, partial [Serratia marcescens]
EWGCTYRLDTGMVAPSQQGGKHALKVCVSLASRCMYYGFVIYLDDKRLAVRAENLPGKYHYPDQVGV